MIKLVVNIRDSDRAPTLITVLFFNEISINLKFDSVASTYKFQMYFNPDDADHAELACVSHIHECKIYYVHEVAGNYATKEIGGKTIFAQTTDELIITGFMLSQLFSNSAKPSFMEIGGYSKPGVLADCDFPTKAYPLQSDGLSIRQIINQKVLPYFSDPASGGFKFIIKSSRADSALSDEASGHKKGKKNKFGFDLSDSDNGEDDNNTDSALDAILGKTTAFESKNILSYLKELCVQKNVVLSTDVFGNLIINIAYTGNSYLFEIGTDKGINYIDMAVNYNGQAMHSQYEVKRQADKNGGNEAYALITNPLVPVVYRPKVITMTSGTDTDAQRLGIAERSAELKNIVLKITLDRGAINGKFILPNNTIRVKNRNCYLYSPQKWFIEEVNYTKSSSDEKCEITCVLPSVYDGSTPINPFVPAGKNLPDLRQ